MKRKPKAPNKTKYVQKDDRVNRTVVYSRRDENLSKHKMPLKEEELLLRKSL
jgi:hypothetical protein